MTRLEAQKIALDKMLELNLVQRGWTFRFIRTYRKGGWCCKRTKTITISIHLVELNSDDLVREVIFHEIGHAIAWDDGHGPIWAHIVEGMGVPARKSIPMVKPKKWTGTCSSCGEDVYLSRRSKSTTYVHSTPTCNGRIVDWRKS